MNPNLVILDQYDDVNGEIFKEVFPSPEVVPQVMKTASYYTAEQLNNLPDEAFALVASDDNAGLKKFATSDRGNTAISTLYFLKTASKLSDEAIKVAACNLIDACNNHGLPVPRELYKMAEEGSSALETTAGKPEGGKSYSSTPEKRQLGKEVDTGDLKNRTNIVSPSGSNFLKMPIVAPNKEFEKTAARIDLSSLFASSAALPGADNDVLTLLGDKYPVGTYEQAERAKDYFTDYGHLMAPEDRHEYCVKLASKLDEYGIPATDMIERYGSTTYSADVDTYVAVRKGYINEEHSEVLDMLLEKRASVGPEIFAETLAEFDTQVGLHGLWGSEIPDPFFSTFGKSLEKVAEDSWVYSAEDGFNLRESHLQRLSHNNLPAVEKVFGKDFASEFQKRPTKIFDSLPDPNKLILARLARSEEVGNV